MLRFGNRRGNGGNDDQQRANAADDSGNADQREQPRCAASVDGVLNRLSLTFIFAWIDVSFGIRCENTDTNVFLKRLIIYRC